MPNLTCLTLSAADLSRSRRFYEALGFEVGFVADEVVFFQMNGSILALYRKEMLEKDLKVPKGRAPRPGGMNPAINLASAKAVDAFWRRAVKAGAKAIRPPHKAVWGGYSSIWADLDGHPWEVAWNPFWKLDKKGNVKLP
jgi:uncharacterized protein